MPDQDEQRGKSSSGIISVKQGKKKRRKTAEERADEEIKRLIKIKAKHCVLEGAMINAKKNMFSFPQTRKDKI